MNKRYQRRYLDTFSMGWRTVASSIVIGFLSLACGAEWTVAQVKPVSIRVPEKVAWVGQGVPFFVELRAQGSFVGAASFDLPQVAGCIVIKIGNPVVSSEKIDGKDWFVQSHEFALFSQRAGQLQFPRFGVRFANRDGFVGEAHDQKGLVPAWEVELKRPPGADGIGFLVSTTSYEVEETWDPLPGTAQVGDVFKRTITQKAPELSGMALAAASTTAPDGVRVYTSPAETQDQIQRGELSGSRTETVTYLLQTPGIKKLPALEYRWWNPATQSLQSEILPAVEFDVAIPIVDDSAADPAASSVRFPWLAVLLTMAVVCSLVIWQSHRIRNWIQVTWKTLNPPDRVAARKLLRACRENDVVAAQDSWCTWRNLTGIDLFQSDENLRIAVLEMEKCFARDRSSGSWQGHDLKIAFKKNLVTDERVSKANSMSDLPGLNP